jgi:hypothetical protein
MTYATVKDVDLYIGNSRLASRDGKRSELRSGRFGRIGFDVDR